MKNLNEHAPADPGQQSYLPSLPLNGEALSTRPLRICIASFDLVGPIRNGGVGTAFTSLAEALAAAGHEVTLLYLSGQWCENKTLEHWVEHYRNKNIRFVPLPEMKLPPLIASWHQSKSYETYLYLRDQSFDIIHFSEWRGPGYYSIMARHQGHAFERTQLCVHTHGPTLWSRLSNGEYVREPEDLDLDFLERKSVELADAVVSPSQYLFQWMRDQGWALSGQSFVQQYVRPATARKPLPVPEGGSLKPDELVFFGRLEVRKGLVLFCDALDRLAGDPALRDVRLTFLGKHTEIDGVMSQPYLEERAKTWPWSWQVLSEEDQTGAMDYLQGGRRLALMPSLADNLPNTVLECLGARVAFLTSDIGGIPEMIAPADLSATCCPLHPGQFAERIRQAVVEGIKPASPALDPVENEAAWVKWHETHVPTHDGEVASLSVEMPDAQPLVSVCISHFNRPHLLRQAIASVQAQDYTNIELVLIDDASTDGEALKYLKELEPLFEQENWQLIRNSQELFVGAARNVAARHARGEYLLFMDDDNCAKPGEVSTFVRAARKTGADILTCFLDFFSGYEPARESQTPIHRVLFLGDAISGGALRNTFGDTNALIRREVFLKLGGFHERRGVGHEDWQLYGDALLKGYHLEVVPEALVWYRRNESEKFATRTNSLHAGHMQNIKPFLDAVPASLRNLILFVQGQSLQLEKGQGQTATAVANSRHTIQWRSLYGAGMVVAKLGHVQEAIHLYLDAIKAAETSQHPGIILEALLHVGKDMGALDRNRARQALQLAKQLAQGVKNEAAHQQAIGLLGILESQAETNESPSTAARLENVVPIRPVQSSPSARGDNGSSSQHFESVVSRVAEHLNHGRNEEALALIEENLRTHPWGARLQPGRALALARLGRNREAREVLLSLPEKERSGGRVRLLLQELERASG